MEEFSFDTVHSLDRNVYIFIQGMDTAQSKFLHNIRLLSIIYRAI